MVEVPVRQADGDRLLDGRGHGAPRAPEQPRDLLPGQRAGPRRQRHQQCVRHLLLPTHPGHRLDMHAGASRAPHAARRVAQRHRDPPQRYMAEAPYWTGVSVRAPRPTLAASGHEAAVWGQLGHQSARVSRHRHDPKPLQFHRRLDQTFQEHESPLRYPGCVTTPKYLMRLMFFNSQPSSACIHLYDEPVVERTRLCPSTADYGQAAELPSGLPHRDAVRGPQYPAVRKQPSGGLASTDSSARAADARVQVGRPSATVRIGARRRPESVPGRPPPAPGSSPPSLESPLVPSLG